MRSIFLLTSLAVVLPALGAPTFAPPTERSVADTYIIKLKDDVSQDKFLSALLPRLTDSKIKYTYTILNGFAANIVPADMPVVRGMQGVEYIEQDQIMSLSTNRERHEPRASSNNDNAYCPKPSLDQNGGEGVTIYGIDTGIKVDHPCFGGRARWGFAFDKLELDGNGHGTHTAGTAACDTWGVATRANVIAVKVLSAAGTGTNSDVIAGIEYACKDFSETKKPSIATMSLGGGASQALDDAITKCADMGMHFTVAAGNDNKDAKDYSPARVPIANTIGAIDYQCNKASFSNFGPVLDIQAPGVDVESAWILPGNSSKKLSGTSMATPYVAGVLAVLLKKYSQMSPAALTAALKSNAAPAAVGFPADTTNLIAKL